MSGTPLSRRALMRTAAVGSLALAAPAALSACSTESGDDGVSNAGKKLAPWPTYKAFSGPKPDLAPTAEGVQPGYTSYPSDLAKSVSRTPGDGSTVKVMTISFGVPPKGRGENRFWQAVEKALGVKIEYTVISQPDYQKKMATVMAGDPGELPDIINVFSGFALPREAQFVQRRAEDLTPFLSGDAVADYPNLANIPSEAWRDMGRIGGRIYGIPLERPLPGSTLWLNEEAFVAAGMREGWTDQDFAAVAKKGTGGKKYALGAAEGSVFGDGFHSAAHGVHARGWSVKKDGTFLPSAADERYKQMLDFQLRLRKAGSYHPDATSSAQPEMIDLYYNGTVGSLQDGFGGYLPKFLEKGREFTPAPALPYSVGGEPRRHRRGTPLVRLHHPQEGEEGAYPAAAARTRLSRGAVRQQGVGTRPLRRGRHPLHPGQGRLARAQRPRPGREQHQPAAEVPRRRTPGAVRARHARRGEGPARLAGEDSPARHPQCLVRAPVPDVHRPGHHPRDAPQGHRHRDHRRTHCRCPSGTRRSRRGVSGVATEWPRSSPRTTPPTHEAAGTGRSRASRASRAKCDRGTGNDMAAKGRVTIREVAERAGVSVATVSRVLSGNHPVPVGHPGPGDACGPCARLRRERARPRPGRRRPQDGRRRAAPGHQPLLRPGRRGRRGGGGRRAAGSAWSAPPGGTRSARWSSCSSCGRRAPGW